MVFWEKVMFFKHLNRLIKLGEVREKGRFLLPGLDIKVLSGLE